MAALGELMSYEMIGNTLNYVSNAMPLQCRVSKSQARSGFQEIEMAQARAQCAHPVIAPRSSVLRLVRVHLPGRTATRTAIMRAFSASRVASSASAAAPGARPTVVASLRDTILATVASAVLLVRHGACGRASARCCAASDREHPQLTTLARHAALPPRAASRAPTPVIPAPQGPVVTLTQARRPRSTPPQASPAFAEPAPVSLASKSMEAEFSAIIAARTGKSAALPSLTAPPTVGVSGPHTLALRLVYAGTPSPPSPPLPPPPWNDPPPPPPPAPAPQAAAPKEAEYKKPAAIKAEALVVVAAPGTKAQVPAPESVQAAAEAPAPVVSPGRPQPAARVPPAQRLRTPTWRTGLLGRHRPRGPAPACRHA
jgi:hypothetical protein